MVPSGLLIHRNCSQACGVARLHSIAESPLLLVTYNPLLPCSVISPLPASPTVNCSQACAVARSAIIAESGSALLLVTYNPLFANSVIFEPTGGLALVIL